VPFKNRPSQSYGPYSSASTDVTSVLQIRRILLLLRLGFYFPDCAKSRNVQYYCERPQQHSGGVDLWQFAEKQDGERWQFAQWLADHYRLHPSLGDMLRDKGELEADS
jgi:hypothetical protein